MNCKNAKLGTRFNLKVNSTTFCTDIINGDVTLPATIIGFESHADEPYRVLIGWSKNDVIRPNDSDSISSLATGSMFQYVNNIDDYKFGCWKSVMADFIASWIDSPIAAKEWKCCLPGCQKMNDLVAKRCYMCGSDVNGRP